MLFAIIKDGEVVNIAEADEDFGISRGWISGEGAKIGDLWDGAQFTTPPVTLSVPSSITALQGLLALDEDGLSDAYEAWANSNDRTFAEKAFINKALTWKRNDPVLLSGADALGLTSSDLDALFIKAGSTKVSSNGA